MNPAASLHSTSGDAEALRLIHDTFTDEIGAEPNYRVHERAYYDFLAAGYTADDLRLVMQYLKLENKRMNGAKHSLRLDRLLDFDYRRFDSLLNCARAVKRNAVLPPTPREVVLHEFRRTAPEPNGKCKHVGEFLKSLREAAA